ncbi:TIGR04255 family protein [Sphingobacterium bambusae]|uniref:TIGR04255 family protein n=1 Tax=Sphingobacterium bambusae TaxID=662858 RepID=A0ABW6BF03_9SPHI|nr:TIGR04255 family protein [Sphingobacterium bambusae]WPL48820.1 TIGR04255 family protein [Sphingobacterium bambusae]
MFPKSISPYRLRDAIVEVRYLSKLPLEILLGMFFTSLDESYKYQRRPVGPQSLPIDPSQQMQLVTGGNSLFYNDSIKFEFFPNSIVFNCLEEYLGWDKYFGEIKKVLHRIDKLAQFESYTRVGLRYISQYEGIDLRTVTKFEFSFGMPDVSSDNFQFRSEFDFGDSIRAVLGISNNLQVLGADNLAARLSTIDIDIIKPIDVHTLDNLLKEIELVHEKEKEVFFNMLQPDFLAQLHPVYQK